MGAWGQTDGAQRKPHTAAPAALAVPSALVLAVGSPTPWTSLGIGLGGALMVAGLGMFVPRLARSQQTAGELVSALAIALLIAAAAATAGLGPGVMAFAAVLITLHVVLCIVWQISALGTVLAAFALALSAWLTGTEVLTAIIGAVGLVAVGLALTLSLTALHRQRAALGRQLSRAQGDLESRKSVEQQLRDTHESLEHRTIQLTDINRRIEREIEVRRKAEEEALEGSRLKDAFLRAVSHELRTPLNAIIGYTEDLLDEDRDRRLGDVAGDHQRILGSAHRLLEMINTVLDLSQIETGKATVEAEPVDAHALAEHVVAAVAVAAESNGNTIRIKCEHDLPTLHTDRAKLRQVLFGLLDNACKFTRDGTVRLVIRTAQHRGRPCMSFEVSDTGIGIDAETIQRIFLPFVQADGATTRRHGGAGIGLTVCRHYCTMLGGEITATSTPGAGSTFTMRLPVERVDPKTSGVILVSNF